MFDAYPDLERKKRAQLKPCPRKSEDLGAAGECLQAKAPRITQGFRFYASSSKRNHRLAGGTIPLLRRYSTICP